MKNIIYIVVIIVTLFMINNLAHSIYSIWQKQDLITKTETELQREKNQHAKLQKQLQKVSEPQFIEEEARNKLFLVRPNEEIIILPSSHPKTSLVQTPTPPILQPNWEQWRDLFFSSDKN